MADPIKRLNYFKHQFLRATDFIEEQKYHMQMRRLHNRSLHTWGVASGGLKVSFVQGATAVKVAEGMAVDSQGREIILGEEKTVELAGFAAGAPVFVTISYSERKTDSSSETGTEGETRWTEEPQLRATPTKPSDVGTELILARVIRNGTTVTSVEETERRSAGVETAELSVRTLRLSRPDVDAGAWPRLSCSAANQAALENGSLKIDANREIFFVDGGQIRTFDNLHRLVFNRPSNRLELHEFGDILFLTGGPVPTEKMRIGAGGNVGIGRVAANERLEVQGNIRGMSLSLIDAAGTWYQDNWLGMASNIEGTTKWLHIGGITDAGARRIVLAADRVYANGRLGIGVTAPEAQLHITGGQWDPSATEGDFKIGNAALRLKMGVALGGGGAGDARIRAHGGTNRLMLGSGTADVLTIQNGNVGIGVTDPKARLQVGALGAINESGGWMNIGSNSFFDGAWKKIDASKPGVNLHMNVDGSGQEFRFLKEDVGSAGRNIAVLGTGLSFIDSPLAISQTSVGTGVMLDVNGRLRLRHTTAQNTGGLWLMGSAGTDRSFIGMANDNDVGFWGNEPGKPGWGFTMDVTTFKIKSPMWRVIRILEAAPGPLPKSVPFVSAGGMMMIFASGSGWHATGGQIGMSVKVDNVARGNVRASTNEGGSHKAFVPVLLVEGIAAGAHTLSLEAFPGTASDHNDFFNVTIVEMPI